jgi:REP element-mobilizing transposase RayT
MPGDHNQFLTKNLSDKLSAIMPDIHEDQGWKMTSITVRPQYLLWTVAIPMGICPTQIMQEVRNLTSNSIFANFAELAKTKTSNDFWSSEYLAVSGSEPAPANLIFDFVNNTWKPPETTAP